MKDLIQTAIQFWPSLALLCLSAIPAAYMVLHETGKARWFGPDRGFFGEHQYLRKYKLGPNVQVPLNNWYYNFFNIRYREAFLFSATFLVSFTDFYHTNQLIMRILMSLSITLAIGAPWYLFLLIWGAYATIHALFYKLLSR